VLIAILQVFLTAAACYGLWRLFLWSAAAMPPLAKRIVTAGFLIRVLAGQALFWISWLRLPVARSMQLGDGIWFFIDGWWYMGYARHLLNEGWMAALTLADARYPSRVFVQILTACVALFGDPASVAILLNCAAYLATCALVVRLRPRGNGAVLFALAAVAFGPGMIVWALQPLKDTVFLLLIAAFVYVCARWQERPRFVLAVPIVALAYALSSIRWYFGMIAWLALGLFFFITALRTQHRVVLLTAALLLFVVVAQAVRLGGREDIPYGVREVLDPRPRIAALWRPSKATQTIKAVRGGFERTQGATSIKPGPTLQAKAPPPPPASPAPATPTPAPVATTTVQPPPVTQTQPAPPPPPARPRVPRRRPPEPAAPSFAARMLSGAAAAFLPRIVAQALGLVDIGGGRGLWIFAELDTIAFDAVLLFAIVYIVRTRPRVTPLFVLVLLLFLGNAAPMIYTVTNFGTLFRLREMLYFLAVLVPLTLAPRAASSTS
jgi:hypothetical protein